MYLIGIVTVFENHANHSTLMQVPGVGKQNGLMLVLNPTPPPHHKEPGDMDTHRRRINTEEKAKVVAAVWGTDFFIFLMAIHVGNTSSCKITEVKQQSKKRQKNPCRPNSFPLGRFEE